jgi:hypothetical protein
MLSLLGFGEVDEAAQRPRARAELIAQAAPDAQVAIEFSTKAHRTPPTTGQGCAIERRPSISSFA